MPCTIYASVSIFSTIMTSTPSIVVTSKYCLYKLFNWIEWFGSTLRWLVIVLLVFVTFALKFWFHFAFISSMTMLTTIVAFSITPTFVWCMTYLTRVIASRFLILLGTLFGGFTFFLVSNPYFTFLSIEILFIHLI